MAKAKQATVEEKLIALYKLQSIDTQIDKIKILRGELPLEVQDLEDEITGLQRDVVFTPTFILFEKENELGRLEGYPGEDFFWALLELMLERETNFKSTTNTE